MPRCGADWLARRAATHDVMYRVEGEVITLKHADFAPGAPDAPAGMEGGYPPEDLALPMLRLWYLDFEQSLFRQETQDEVLNTDTMESKTRKAVDAYDGQTPVDG